MRNKYGIIPIKIRTKPDKIAELDFNNDVESVTQEVVDIDGKVSDAKNGKIVLLDIELEDSQDAMIICKSLVTISGDTIYCYGVLDTSNKLFLITISDLYFNITPIVY